MFQFKRYAAACVMALSFASSPAWSQVTLATDTTQVYSTTSVTASATGGNLMAGMQVSATFQGGGTETVSWLATGATSGSVTGSGWSISVASDTFSSPWILSNTAALPITRLLFNGTGGNTIFDSAMGGNTAGSFSGINFGVSSGLGADAILATYRGPIALGSDPALLDVYLFLDLQWQSSTSFGSGRTLNFVQDSDNASTNVIPVPEPVLLPALGLVSFAFARRFRR